MDKQSIKRKIRKEEQHKTITLAIRITPDASEWLKKNNYSPAGIFNEALKDLGYKQEVKNGKDKV
jgi:hypothetical protein